MRWLHNVVLTIFYKVFSPFIRETMELTLLLQLYMSYFFAESVDRLMNESHELGGSTIAVDRATPKVSCG